MKYKIFLAIFVISLISSIILVLDSAGNTCKLEGCNEVQGSNYAYFFGIKNSLYGIFVFTLLILATLLHMKRPKEHTRLIINWGIFLGSLVAIYFIILQAFVIKSFCQWCLVVDIGLIVALGTMVIYEK